ncbi:hypothetical protein N7520_003784 [Penicillium odoratum]|uniref:uncharacterized protein n=1 Tax=Penicillium odoratum TaxID=1167516 RepID=UPI002548C643|nr:uncharacterized protein N7520_003784 [Penicillium odoratum]KAJ5769225.1 hypothetical protein N7520_003784 [Penicillium odoratum]
MVSAVDTHGESKYGSEIPAPAGRNLAARAGNDGCPSTISGGAIAGIVIGTIAGTLLLLWLWRVCRLPGAWSGGGEPDVGYRPPVTRTRGRRRRSTGSYVDVIEKPHSSRSSRQYRENVRRPAKVYLS